MSTSASLKTAQYFDRITPYYEQGSRADAWYKVNDFVRQNRRRWQDLTGQTALDLGAGSGKTLSVVQGFARPERIIAVDASAKMLELLRQKYPSDRIQTHQSPIEDYVADTTDRFDIITSVGSLEFVPNLPAVCTNIGHLLKDNGILLATFIPNTYRPESQRSFDVPSMGVGFTEYYWDPEQITQSLTDGGLTVAIDYRPGYKRGDEVVEYGFITAIK